jgi:23S rRNA (uracil1939-C5)-methyltransferase
MGKITRKRSRLPEGDFVADVFDLDHEGRGVARVEGKVTFILDALPGEQVAFRYLRTGKQADEGQVTEVLRAAPERVQPPCQHFGLCGGCSMQHLAASHQIFWKQKQMLDVLQRVGKVVPETIAEPLTSATEGYRRKARMGAKWVAQKDKALVGFRERGTHFLAQLDTCAVLDPRVGQNLKAIAEVIAGLSIKNQVPQIEVGVGEHVSLVFRVMSEPSEDDKAALLALGQRFDYDILLQGGGYDTITPLSTVRELRYSPSDGLWLHFQPADFIQVNDGINRQMIAQALDWLGDFDTVLELFCGLGNFTAPLAQKGKVVAVEGDKGLVERGRANLARHGLAADYHYGDLFKPKADAPYLQTAFDACLLDPPRAGAAEILPFIVQKAPQRIVYVSCHPGTLARDAAFLAENGYRLEKAGVMDMFPHTSHVESMALFVRDAA